MKSPKALSLTTCILSAFFLNAVFTIALAQDEAPKSEESQEEATTKDADTDYEALVLKLNSDSFLDREKAARDLAKGGATAVPALIDVAVDGDVEVKQRALGILKKLASESDEATIAALEKFTESDDPKEVEIAKSVLKLAVNSRTGEIPRDEFAIPGMEVNKGDDFLELTMEGGGRIRMGLKKGAGFSRSSINTGVGYAILAGSNMGEQMVSAVGPEGDVWILATRQEEGEPVERAFRYNSLEEMKEKNAELHKLYERFKSGGRPRAIPGLGLKGGGIPLPADAGAALERHKEMMLKMEARMEEARARAEELRKRAEEARKPKPKKEDWVDKPI